jgi:hypothetical protein
MEFRIERGVPTDEELAAITGILFARPVVPVTAAAMPVSRWAMSARPGITRPDGRPSRPSRDGWRASAMPR